MTSPTFKKSIVQETDPTNKMYGAPDWKYATDVLDGSHATDRVQINNIEGMSRMSDVNWIVRKRPGDDSVIEIIDIRTGLAVHVGTVLYPLLQNLNDNVDFKDGHQVLIRPCNTPGDSYLAIQGGLSLPVQLNLTKDMTIYGYGAKLRGGTTSHQSGGAIRITTDKKILRVFGLTIDSSNDGTANTKSIGVMISGGEFGDTAPAFTPRLIHLKDCNFLNVYNRGVHCETQDPSQFGQGDLTVLIENCLFTSGSPGSIQTFLGINSSKHLIVNNCTFLGNNNVYSAAENISLTNCYFNQVGVDFNGTLPQGGNVGHGGVGLQGKNIYISGVTVIHKDGFSIRSYGTIHAGVLVDKATRITVKGCTVLPWDPVTQTCTNIEIAAYNDTDKSIDEITISECVFPYDRPLSINVADPALAHGRIGKLVLDNIYMGEFDNSSRLLNVVDHDIEYLKISNIKTPSWPSSVNAGVATFDAQNANITIGYMRVEGNGPAETANEKFIATLSDSVTGTTNPISVTVASPLSKGENLFRSTGAGGGIKTMKFLQNWGTATFSGNGSNTTFNIPHSLVSSPSNGYVHVNAASSAARGDFHITADATNITINYASAPASGSNNVVLYWIANAV